MKYLLTLILLGGMLAGCSSAPNKESPKSVVPPGNPGIASIATEGRFTEEAPTDKHDFIGAPAGHDREFASDPAHARSGKRQQFGAHSDTPFD